MTILDIQQSFNKSELGSMPILLVGHYDTWRGGGGGGMRKREEGKGYSVPSNILLRAPN